MALPIFDGGILRTEPTATRDPDSRQLEATYG